MRTARFPTMDDSVAVHGGRGGYLPPPRIPIFGKRTYRGFRKVAIFAWPDRL